MRLSRAAIWSEIPARNACTSSRRYPRMTTGNSLLAISVGFTACPPQALSVRLHFTWRGRGALGQWSDGRQEVALRVRSHEEITPEATDPTESEIGTTLGI